MRVYKQKIDGSSARRADLKATWLAPGIVLLTSTRLMFVSWSSRRIRSAATRAFCWTSAAISVLRALVRALLKTPSIMMTNSAKIASATRSSIRVTPC